MGSKKTKIKSYRLYGRYTGMQGSKEGLYAWSVTITGWGLQDDWVIDLASQQRERLTIRRCDTVSVKIILYS